jgi:ATP-dependent DNA helicase RecQ
LQTIQALNENFQIKMVIDFLVGRETKMILDYKLNDNDLFGEGDEKDELYWNSIIRAGLLADLIYKDIELYGVLKLTDEGKKFVKEPQPFKLTLNHNFEEVPDEPEGGGGGGAVLDEVLFNILKDLNKRVAKKAGVPTFVVFQEPSLMDMSTQYPISEDDLLQCSGVSAGKISRYGQQFIEAIQKYVEENEIERPTDYVVKSIANKSKTKVTIIQSIDKKIPLDEIAETNGFKWDELMDELYAIVTAGTKLNIKYYIDSEIDEYVQEIVVDYFKDADTDDVDKAFKAALKEDDDITFEEVQVMRIKFLSDNN